MAWLFPKVRCQLECSGMLDAQPATIFSIEFALVCEHKDIAFLFWDIFCGACSQWGELASIMRKGRNFSNYQIMLISFIDFKLNKRCPRLGMQCLCVHTLVQKLNTSFYLYIDEEMCLNLKPIFENNAL